MAVIDSYSLGVDTLNLVHTILLPLLSFSAKNDRRVAPAGLGDERHEGLRWIVRKSAEEAWMLDLAARNPKVAGPVAQLLGQE